MKTVNQTELKEKFLAEIEKQKENLLKYKKAKFGDLTAKKLCLSSIFGIRELMYEVAERAKENNMEYVQIKAGFVATMANDLYNQFCYEIEGESHAEYTNGHEIE